MNKNPGGSLTPRCESCPARAPASSPTPSRPPSVSSSDRNQPSRTLKPTRSRSQTLLTKYDVIPIAHTRIKINSPSPKAFLSNPSRWSSRAGPGLFLNQRVPFSHVSVVSSPAPVCGIGSSSTPSANAPSCRQSPSESLSGPVDKTRRQTNCPYGN